MNFYRNTIQTTIETVTRTTAIVAAIALVAACSSTAQKPVQPDGSSRVPANDPARVQALQDRVAQDRVLLTENNLLKAQVTVLTQKLNDMTNIVREALVLPPPAITPAPAPTLAPRQAPQPQSPQPQGRLPEKLSFDLPEEAYSVNKNGVVIRVFHDLARTDFEPSPEVAQALRTAVRDADSVWVRGRTDSDSPDAINRLIAIERAMKARTWLVNNGVPAAKITTRFSSSGLFLADNATLEGKALNRRVEIDIRHSAAS